MKKNIDIHTGRVQNVVCDELGKAKNPGPHRRRRRRVPSEASDRAVAERRDALRVNVPMHGVVRRAPHPCHPADAKFQSSRIAWFVERPELRTDLDFWDTTTIAKMGALVGQGTALGCFAASGTVDGPSRSILMSAAIGQADAKRRCLAAGSELVLPSIGNCA